MTRPLSIERFNAFKAAVATTLVPLLCPDVRGIEARLNPRRRHVDVVLFHAGEFPQLDDVSLVPLRDALSAVPRQFDDFAGYTTNLSAEPCDPDAPLIYRGCPVWGRRQTEWQLAPDIAAMIAARR